MKKLFSIFLVLTLSIILVGCSSSNAENKKVRIGYQKNGTTLLLKANGDLESRLKELGYSVEWSEFNTGSSILEALNSGAIDFANASDAPSVMALSKGMNFKYIAAENSSPQMEGILVKNNDAIQSIEQLKGKKIAYNKASISEYLLVSALATVNLTLDDVQSVILSPADANIAFENGDVDAWAIWDPYMTVSESKGNKILTTAEGIVEHRSFYYASEKFIKSNEDAVIAYVEELAKVGEAIDTDSSEAASILEENTGISADIWSTSLGRRSSVATYLDESAQADLQRLNEDLYDIELTTNLVENIENYIWKP
ncbi:sulfonate ABC transporter substrate-binding protein [Solibacillus merdavium]|uniref:Sulfonate ABC transporter substrate-binding protein n=1 Tax=Solibacillus merdavium TaxID=2762218 RepID=A0ABR8XK22_9BACL|nr:sulfonate ABC transporter substrate-binding protein [Solibacillus merdavium]MBD8032290.1 sulfonate ABC transporter substrate-binding protein [Solibacillus merdavium]